MQKIQNKKKKTKKLKALLNQTADDISVQPIYFGHVDSVKQMKLQFSHNNRNFIVTGRRVATKERPETQTVQMLTPASTQSVKEKVLSPRFKHSFVEVLKNLVDGGVDFYTTEHTQWKGNTFHWTSREMKR